MLEHLETKISSAGIGNELLDTCDIHNHVLDLKDMLQREKMDYHVSRTILYLVSIIILILGYLVSESKSVVCGCLF